MNNYAYKQLWVLVLYYCILPVYYTIYTLIRYEENNKYKERKIKNTHY